MFIINARVYARYDYIVENGYVEISGDKIVRVGKMSSIDGESLCDVIDAKGGYLFPGFVDAHTHLGLWGDGSGFEGDDGNEDTDASTPHLRAIDAVNPIDRAFEEARASGVTTIVTGPGSANPISGQMLAMKTYGHSLEEMVIKSPVAIKMSLGENPKTVYHEKNQSPVTRMATAAIIRDQLYRAKRYLNDKNAAKKDKKTNSPDYDIKCESLVKLLTGEVKAHFHAHRADDIATAIRIAKEFELKLVLVHCTEGHIIYEQLKKADCDVIVGPLISCRTKPELKNFELYNPKILFENDIRVSICTDHPVVPIYYLSLTAGLARLNGLSLEDTLAAITINPAKTCGVDDRVGSLEPGKDADIVLFSECPFERLSKPAMVICGGKRLF